jgi:1-deoxy-D-xylulose-5-phosphate reductoisomerase
MKRLAILGSTGSIGRSTLAVVAEHPEEFSVVVLAAGKNMALLAEQIQRFHPVLVSVQDETRAAQLREQIGPGPIPEILPGRAGALAVATASGVELVVSAMVGAVGLEPTMAAIRANLPVALANK